MAKPHIAVHAITADTAKTPFLDTLTPEPITYMLSHIPREQVDMIGARQRIENVAMV